MELALGHIVIIFSSFAISYEMYNTINRFRDKRDKPEFRECVQ